MSIGHEIRVTYHQPMYPMIKCWFLVLLMGNTTWFHLSVFLSYVLIQSGIYWLNLIDWYSAGWGLIIIAVLELIGVMWVYGGNRFIEDIEMMIGRKHWIFWFYWRACWFFISPLLLLVRGRPMLFVFLSFSSVQIKFIIYYICIWYNKVQGDVTKYNVT